MPSASAPEIAGRRVSAISNRLSAIQLSRKAAREIVSTSVRISTSSAASCGATTSATRHSPAPTGPAASATACEEFEMGDGAIPERELDPARTGPWAGDSQEANRGGRTAPVS